MSVSIGSSLPKALLNRKPPISFSGCGFLLPYHFGAALAVKKKSVLLDDIEKIGGCSGGVLMAILSFMEVEEWRIFSSIYTRLDLESFPLNIETFYLRFLICFKFFLHSFSRISHKFSFLNLRHSLAMKT
ncbi:MAG: hypothetical protein MHMPM18_004313 [Marteilia pararefringens]